MQPVITAAQFLYTYKTIFFCVLFFMSILSFSLYGIDKNKAQKGKWRISEKTLLLSAALFGGIGAFCGMHIFHHKTRHWYFRLFVPMFMVLQIAVILFVIAAGKCNSSCVL